MYQVEDLVVYKQTGVCKVVEVGTFKAINSRDLYYTLEPVYSSGTIYIPVNTDSYLREIINADEAQSWLNKISEIPDLICADKRIPMQKDFYSKIIQSHDFTQLIGLIKGLLKKSRQIIKGKKPLTAAEEQFLKTAEDLVYQEFASALNKDIDEIAEIFKKSSL